MDDETTAVVVFDAKIEDLTANATDPTDDQVFALLRGYDYPVQVGRYMARAAVWAVGQNTTEFFRTTQDISESIGLRGHSAETFGSLEAMWDANVEPEETP